MGRPVGSKNKTTGIDMPIVFPNALGVTREEISKALPDRKQFTESIHYDEILGVRMLRNGRFRGLWELVRLDDQGKVKQVLTDANTKQFIITMSSRQIYKIVAVL